MTSKDRPSFSPKSFLAEANGGRHIVEYRKDQIVFSQGARRSDRRLLAQGQDLDSDSPGRDRHECRGSPQGWPAPVEGAAAADRKSLKTLA